MSKGRGPVVVPPTIRGIDDFDLVGNNLLPLEIRLFTFLSQTGPVINTTPRPSLISGELFLSIRKQVRNS